MYPNYPNQRSPSSQSLYPNSGSIGFNDPMYQSDYPPQSGFPVYRSGQPGFPFQQIFPNPASVGFNNSMYPNQSGNPPQSGFPVYTDYSENSSLPPPLSSYPGQQSYQNFPTYNSSPHNQPGFSSSQSSSISSYSNQSGYPSNESHFNLGYLPAHIAANPSFQPTQFYGGSPDIYDIYGSKNLHQNQSVQNPDLYQSFNPSDDAHTLYRAMKDLRTDDTALKNLEVIRPFKDQVFDELKFQHYESNLFEDPLFPANSRSLFFTQMPPQGVMWLRPKEANPDAEFVTAGFGRCDMDQGYLGNCWFIAGCVGIMQCPKLFAKVVPDDQGFGEGYGGIFHFRFWLYGEWVDVVIDDRLPFWPDGKLVFSSNRDEPNEYWPSLLEKAYAKLYGSYESLDAGQTYDALVDMTGGVQEQIDLKKLSYSEISKLWNVLFKSFKNNSIMGCSINADPNVREARLSSGLVRGHAYTITKVEEYDGNKLLRIRNPWGNEVEWNGAWSDHSSEWESLSESDRLDAGLVKVFDGEFWMCFEDFLEHWDSLQICHMTPESFSEHLLEYDSDPNLEWHCTYFQSEWIRGKNAGGCGNGDSAKFWKNPQFLIQLYDVDNDDNENKATVVIALMQKDTRLRRFLEKSSESQEEFIQFKLFRIKDGVDVDDVKNNHSMLYATQLERIGASGPYINSREVTKRFTVEPGNYLIIPSTYDYGKECEFMIRVFTQREIDSGSLDKRKNDLDPEDSHLEDIPEDMTFKQWKSFINPKIMSHLKSLHNFGKSVFTTKDGKIGLKVGNIKKLIQDESGNINLNSIQGSIGNAHSALKDFHHEFSKFTSFFKK